MNTNDHRNPIEEVMRAIRSGDVKMKPRWHFVLSGTLAALGCIILFLTLLYVASFAIFGMRQSGALFVPVFGMRGIFVFFHALPGILITLLVAFVVVLEILVRRYRFGYRAPLLVSVVVILMVVLAGGAALERTRFHAALARQARLHQLPSPFGDMYAPPPHPPEVYRGSIVSLTKDGFIMFDENDDGTTTVHIDGATRLPFGSGFTTGEEVVVFGDESVEGSNDVRAFGIKSFDE